MQGIKGFNCHSLKLETNFIVSNDDENYFQSFVESLIIIVLMDTIKVFYEFYNECCKCGFCCNIEIFM